MRRTSGFTLLEVMVAMVLTSVVVLLASASARVTHDVHARLGGALSGQQRARASRELLRDVLRNVRSARTAADTTFWLERGRLSFIAAGPGPPFDPDYDWRITIAPDSAGLALLAVPVGRAPPTPVGFRLHGVRAWDVQLLLPNEPTWTREWPAPGMPPIPRAVSIAFRGDGDAVDPPLEVVLTPPTTAPSR